MSILSKFRYKITDISVFQSIKDKMASCTFCKVSKDKLKRCVCGLAFYCNRECQTNDWDNHRPSCPPFIIKESPGKGKGVFASRKLNEGQVIIDEYPLLTLSGAISVAKFEADHYPFIDEETKAKILTLHDEAENFKTLDQQGSRLAVIEGSRG